MEKRIYPDKKTIFKYLKHLEGRWYETTEDLWYDIPVTPIKVPKGFKTNLASIPKILHRWYDPLGEYSNASVLHDYLYSDKSDVGLNRAHSDFIFKIMMNKDGVDADVVKDFYVAVRLFGESFCKDTKQDGSRPPDKVFFVGHEFRDITLYYKRKSEYKKYLKRIRKKWPFIKF